MFKIVSKPTFTHDVPVMVPVDGGHDERTLKTRFRVLDISEMEKFEPLTTLKNQTAFLNAVVEGFEDLEDEAGKPVTSSQAVKDRLLATSYVRLALMVAYERAITKAKEKN